jgi:DHA2 family multidrug resistance protein-like MFS transporter
MDLTVLNLALPALSEDLRPSSTQLLWIVDIYGFLVAGLLITMGTLGDRIGRRRLLLIGAGAFGLASLFAALATSAEMLIAARALLGVAGATLAPSTLSLIRTMFNDARERTFAIGVWITSFSAGAAIGPLVGGLLLERFWWGSVFLPALPVMALLLAVGTRLLPEYRDPDAGKLAVSLAVNMFGFFVNFGIAVFLAQYLQLVVGLSPFEAGLWTVPYAAAFVLGALLTPVLVRRIRPAFVIAGGLALAGCGFVVLTQVDAGSALATVVSGAALFALGLAPVYTLAADLMVGAAPPERAGAAAGISETSSEFGGALGIAVLGAVGTAVYRGQVDTSLPTGLPSDTAEAARDTLGAALGASDRLPDSVALDLVDAARGAFTEALQLAATISAAVAVGAGILAVALLRGVRTGSEAEEHRELEPERALGHCRPC